MRLFKDLTTAIALTAALLTSLPAKAETMTPQATLEALMTPKGLTAARFDARFLAQVSFAEVEALVASLIAKHGPLQGIHTAGEGFTLRFARANLPTSITLDKDDRIIGLWFGAAETQGAIADLAQEIQALPGKTALLVISNGQDIFAHAAEQPLAVGSAAKLAVLVAVQGAVEQGRLRWDQVVPLDPAWKSLPSGQLQDWPDGTPLTLATLANLMISISDNTATDALIRIAGREVVEAISPANAPFPTTRELFTLKTADKAPMRAEWVAGDAAVRRAILDGIAKEPLPPVGAISSSATHEVEWFFTARELCRLLDQTAALPSVGINPGLASAKAWKSVAYKGGSEIGVLNLSTRVVNRDGGVHCVVASWNDDAPLDDEKLFAPYRGILNRLAERE
ncbi:serine hydrolase [Kaistia terrae]|uniref:Serine hydrolase n=1 Tax=Kaistia terrae TaxID=537017 RepID=A0ABW0PSB6_9HYPH|nr:serine hydrolase [Kaistia terrae]MCX5577457.1 serine hydrolase [Kaistia terrae]